MAELDRDLAKFARWLEEEQIPYMVIGGFAVTVWGNPRFTRDLDVTIWVTPDAFDAAVARICAEFKALPTDPLRFAEETRVLPVVCGSTSVDVIFAALPYEEQAIHRARRLNIGAGEVQICAPEDLVLYKIVSQRPRDKEDIEGVFRYRRSELDFTYLDPRVEELSGALADSTMLTWYRALRERWKM
jgi:hypothetical protein